MRKLLFCLVALWVLQVAMIPLQPRGLQCVTDGGLLERLSLGN